MAKEFNLPDIGSGLQEAEIVNWLVKEGDIVTTDQVLCEVETEKSLVEIPVPHAGVILRLAGPPGTSVMVGELLVVIGEPGETPDDVASEDAPAPAAASEPGIEVAEHAAAAALVPELASGRPNAMPLVRKLAREKGIDLRQIAGTGVGGRITRKDVEAAAAGAASFGAAATAPARATRSTVRRPLAKLRRTIAAHMTEQWTTVPHITAHIDADATRFLSMRKSLSEKLGKKIPVDALLTAMIIPALRQVPEANAEIDGDDILIKEYYDIGIAVGSADGLLVPVVRNADQLSLADLADVVADLTSRAKDRKVTPEEMGGQTFTISNLGGLRGQHATQVIPAGTTAIVSIGLSRPQPVVRDGEIVVAPVMPISGTFDHRSMDGLGAMGMLNAFVDIIEEPTLLLV